MVPLSLTYKRKTMKKANTTPKRIDRQMWFGSQSAHYRDICEINGLRTENAIKIVF